jgi:hypothetical protein
MQPHSTRRELITQQNGVYNISSEDDDKGKYESELEDPNPHIPISPIL